MINATSKAIESYLSSHSFVAITTTTSVIAIVLLLLVAAEREILRSTRAEGSARDLAPFTVVIVPMMMLFTSVIVFRFLELS